MEVAKCHVYDVGKTRCSCKHCQNSMTQTLDGVERHLFTYEISSLYITNGFIMEKQRT